MNFIAEETSETYGEWLWAFFRLYKQERGSLKDRYLLDMEKYVARIDIALGRFKLPELSGVHIQVYINSVEAGNTRKKIAQIIDESLRKAVALQKIIYNPFDAVEVPGYTKGNYRHLELDEQNKIWNYYLNPVAYYNYLDVTPYKSVFFFLCCTGMRVGEFLALDWKKDLDRRKLTIRIDKSMDKETGKIDTPKTLCSIRTIRVLPELLPYIEVIQKK